MGMSAKALTRNNAKSGILAASRKLADKYNSTAEQEENKVSESPILADNEYGAATSMEKRLTPKPQVPAKIDEIFEKKE